MKYRRMACLIALVALAGAACGGASVATPTATSTTPTTAAPTATPPAAPPAATPSPTATPQIGLKGPLGDGRQIQTATLLADGGVLVAGGFTSGDGPLASATRYDPGTGVFSQTGSMANARGGHTATLLPDGHVLIAGGGPASWTGGDPTFLAAAELYDPKTGAFAATGPMSTPRESHTATLLSDGRVLIVGGDAGTWSYDGPFYASAEIYNPKTGVFSPTGSMATPRAWQTATPLADGRVLVVGGENARTDLATAEIYTPKSGKFSPTGSMTVGRVYHAAALLSDGRVLVEGGGSDYSGGQFLASAELYDPKTGRWTATGPMAGQRNLLTATLLTDGRVLVAGGFGAADPVATAEVYDPKSGTFSQVGPGG